MKNYKEKIILNEEIAKDTFKLVIEKDKELQFKPGQFVELKIDEYFLRRPISVADFDENSFTLIYKIMGEGTQKLSEYKSGKILDFLAPLGNSFPILKDKNILLLGGGVGCAPLFALAKELKNLDANVQIVLGFSDKDSIFYEKEFKDLYPNLAICTMDASYMIKGNVIDGVKAMEFKNDFVYACGPNVMLKAISKNYEFGYISLEARMACGIGACVGCVCKDKDQNNLRVCKDGPVFQMQRIELWI